MADLREGLAQQQKALTRIPQTAGESERREAVGRADNLAGKSVDDRYTHHQRADPLSRIDGAEIGVTHRAGGVEVAEWH